jgi:hypothetical protein
MAEAIKVLKVIESRNDVNL